MKASATVAASFGLGFEAYRTHTKVPCLDVYLGPLTLSVRGEEPDPRRIVGPMYERDPMAGECAHLWSNWSAITSISIPHSGSMFGGTPSHFECDVQTRHCFSCNLHQRKMLS